MPSSQGPQTRGGGGHPPGRERDIDLWFNSRFSINLRHPVTPDKILVSKTRVSEFKAWFTRQKE